MKDTELFAQLLNLEEPWKIDYLEANIEEKQIAINVSHPSKIYAKCPKCGKLCSQYDHASLRRWRHLDTMQFSTIIESSIPRINCDKHGVLTIAIPWAERNARFTELFEYFAIRLLESCKANTQACKILRITWDEMQHIKEKAVERGLKKRRLEDIEYLGIDEKSFLRRHRYSTVLTDPVNNRVLDVIENRTEDVSREIINRTLDENQKDAIKAVSVDMWQAFMNAISKELPKALAVHDMFHIAKYLNDAVNKVRAKEHQELLKEQINRLAKSKWIWLKNQRNWTEKERELFDILKDGNFKVAKAWKIKEQFKGFCFSATVEEGKEYFDKWYDMAIESGLMPIIKVAKMLKSKLEGILNYLKHRITNASAEGMNSLIQGLKTTARGYRNFENYRISILFHFGKLSLYP